MDTYLFSDVSELENLLIENNPIYLNNRILLNQTLFYFFGKYSAFYTHSGLGVSELENDYPKWLFPNKIEYSATLFCKFSKEKYPIQEINSLKAEYVVEQLNSLTNHKSLVTNWNQYLKLNNKSINKVLKSYRNCRGRFIERDLILKDFEEMKFNYLSKKINFLN